MAFGTWTKIQSAFTIAAMVRIFGWVMFATLVVVLVINWACMLISPRTWLRLPGWLNSAGPSFRERYTDGRGLMELRFVGAVCLAFIGWFIYYEISIR